MSMISLIKFSGTQILERELAENLGLPYTEVQRVGARDSKLQAMDSRDCYRDQLIKDGEDYFLDGVKIGYWYIYDRVPEKDYVKVEESGHMVDLQVFAPKCPIPFSIEKSIVSKPATSEDMQGLLQQLEEKMLRLKHLTENFGPNFNSKCNVHVGGGLIAQFNELLLKEDCCTDVLQQALNQGWRIIAACVQPNARRPDYILGRYNPNYEPEGSAKR
jgi:hypothetical protein